MRVACIGNIVYDCTVYTNQNLKEGGKNSFNNVSFNTGGPASTAASVIAKGDDQVDFYGQIGQDSMGAIVYNEMYDEGIDMRHVNKSTNSMTPFGFIIVNTANAERTICSIRSQRDFAKAKIDDVQFETGYDYILTDGKYAEDSIKLIEQNPQAVTIIDAGRVNDDVIKVCQVIDYIICSEEFANGITGMTINNDYNNNLTIYAKLKHRFPNAKGITITIGKKGYICEKDNMLVTMPAYDPGMKSIDTNGAGDIFHGAFTHAMAYGYDYHKSLEFANVTAAISTTRHGGRKSCPDLKEVHRLFDDRGLTRVPKKSDK